MWRGPHAEWPGSVVAMVLRWEYVLRLLWIRGLDDRVLCSLSVTVSWWRSSGAVGACSGSCLGVAQR
jgi:hypothetical protein